MQIPKPQNAVNAILSEYERAILDLQNTIKNISAEDLMTVVDSTTSNPDCRSIQTILTHVVNSGYSYCIYIRKLKNGNLDRPERTDRRSIPEYIKDLDNVKKFTRQTFENIADNELEIFENSKKMLTRWNQHYDLEQLMEHAIVHILRHRRQIEKFMGILKNPHQ